MSNAIRKRNCRWARRLTTILFFYFNKLFENDVLMNTNQGSTVYALEIFQRGKENKYVQILERSFTWLCKPNYHLTLFVQGNMELTEFLSPWMKLRSGLVEQFMSRLDIGSAVYSDWFYWNTSQKAKEESSHFQCHHGHKIHTQYMAQTVRQIQFCLCHSSWESTQENILFSLQKYFSVLTWPLSHWLRKH